jgi:hypothetical protein
MSRTCRATANSRSCLAIVSVRDVGVTTPCKIPTGDAEAISVRDMPNASVKDRRAVNNRASNTLSDNASLLPTKTPVCLLSETDICRASDRDKYEIKDAVSVIPNNTASAADLITSSNSCEDSVTDKPSESDAAIRTAPTSSTRLESVNAIDSVSRR